MSSKNHVLKLNLTFIVTHSFRMYVRYNSPWIRPWNQIYEKRSRTGFQRRLCYKIIKRESCACSRLNSTLRQRAFHNGRSLIVVPIYHNLRSLHNDKICHNENQGQARYRFAKCRRFLLRASGFALRKISISLRLKVYKISLCWKRARDTTISCFHVPRNARDKVRNRFWSRYTHVYTYNVRLTSVIKYCRMWFNLQSINFACNIATISVV